MDALDLLRDMKKQRLALQERERNLVVILHEAGVSYKDIADALGVSRQYAQKIGSINGATVRNKT